MTDWIRVSTRLPAKDQLCLILNPDRDAVIGPIKFMPAPAGAKSLGAWVDIGTGKMDANDHIVMPVDVVGWWAAFTPPPLIDVVPSTSPAAA